MAEENQMSFYNQMDNSSPKTNRNDKQGEKIAFNVYNIVAIDSDGNRIAQNLDSFNQEKFIAFDKLTVNFNSINDLVFYYNKDYNHGDISGIYVEHVIKDRFDQPKVINMPILYNNHREAVLPEFKDSLHLKLKNTDNYDFLMQLFKYIGREEKRFMEARIDAKSNIKQFQDRCNSGIKWEEDSTTLEAETKKSINKVLDIIFDHYGSYRETYDFFKKYQEKEYIKKNSAEYNQEIKDQRRIAQDNIDKFFREGGIDITPKKK